MQIRDNKTGLVTFKVSDAKGVDDTIAAGVMPTWSVSDESIATIAPAADGMSAVVTPVAVGSFQVKIDVPAQGEEAELTASLDCAVVPGTATTIVLSGQEQA